MNFNQRILDNIICMQIFGMSYDDFIKEAKQHAGTQWNQIGWDDELEAARDELSVESLQALSQAESACADALNSASAMVGKTTLFEVLPMIQEVIKGIKVPEDKIWYQKK